MHLAVRWPLRLAAPSLPHKRCIGRRAGRARPPRAWTGQAQVRARPGRAARLGAVGRDDADGVQRHAARLQRGHQLAHHARLGRVAQRVAGLPLGRAGPLQVQEQHARLRRQRLCAPRARAVSVLCCTLLPQQRAARAGAPDRPAAATERDLHVFGPGWGPARPPAASCTGRAGRAGTCTPRALQRRSGRGQGRRAPAGAMRACPRARRRRGPSPGARPPRPPTRTAAARCTPGGWPGP